MGQPSIMIQFQTAAQESISLLSKGVVGVILRQIGEDTTPNGAYSITSADEIPQGQLRRHPLLLAAHKDSPRFGLQNIAGHF